MRILIIGGGGREHALAWALLQSNQVEQVWCAPGNGGTANLDRCQNLNLRETDFPALVQACQERVIDLVVVGPEIPLALGITDFFQAHQIAVFGPNQAGAQLEASKAWAKGLMAQAGIPTAASATFTTAESAQAYVQAQGAPIVIKADGLAAGKGVTVALDLATAAGAIDEAFQGKFGAAGQCVVIEEYLTGAEVSVLALTDGKTLRPLVPAQDHKRIGEGDTGPNTGGMGAYAPAPLVTPALMERIDQEILQPALGGLQELGIDYCGVIYAGLMITPNGDPKVIEFNCRFGDPETQVVLPLLETPLIDLLQACVAGRLDACPPIRWKPEVAACVVAASGGYPGGYEKGKEIRGLEVVERGELGELEGTIVFQAGTQLQDPIQDPESPEQMLVTSGGRVLAVTAFGEDFDQGFDRAYQALRQINFEGIYYRRDIGYQVRKQ